MTTLASAAGFVYGQQRHLAARVFLIAILALSVTEVLLATREVLWTGHNPVFETTPAWLVRK